MAATSQIDICSLVQQNLDDGIVLADNGRDQRVGVPSTPTVDGSTSIEERLECSLMTFLCRCAERSAESCTDDLGARMLR